MRVITINLPDKYVDAIQILKDMNMYPSRSEAVRVALSEFLTDEFRLAQNLIPENFKLLMIKKGGRN